MTDRELLELAAKAALGKTCIPNQPEDMVMKGWAPLEDDGAAFRLAVCLGIRIGFRPAAYADTPSGIRFFGRDAVSDGADKYARARHAIVRAAAEIGRSMK